MTLLTEVNNILKDYLKQAQDLKNLPKNKRKEKRKEKKKEKKRKEKIEFYKNQKPLKWGLKFGFYACLLCHRQDVRHGLFLSRVLLV